MRGCWGQGMMGTRDYRGNGWCGQWVIGAMGDRGNGWCGERIP